MRYLLTIMIVGLLSCKKDSVNDAVTATPPTITKVEVVSETVGGVIRPKFIITLNVPDSTTVRQLEIYQNSRFPALQSGIVLNPKSGEYTIIDMTATYPPSATIKYFAFFTMNNYNYVSYYPFEVK